MVFGHGMNKHFPTQVLWISGFMDSLSVHTRQLAYRHTPIICIQRLKLSKHTYVLKLLEYVLSVITLPATRQRRCEDVSCQLGGRDRV